MLVRLDTAQTDKGCDQLRGHAYLPAVSILQCRRRGKLRKRALPFYRLNSENLPAATVRFDPYPDKGWEIDLDGKALRLHEVKAACYRRPGVPAPEPTSDAATREYRAGEWSAITRSLWNALEGRWLNSPFAILRAEDKPRQLALALSLGFDVPETLVSNDFDAAQPFLAARNVVGKPPPICRWSRR